MPFDAGGLEQLERLGRRSYRVAWEATAYRQAGMGGPLHDAAEHFRHARMILNLLTDRYLFRQRERWFPLGA